MTYVVLARKWRPMGFDDLVGQGHISQTLANAIASQRVAHAFLFTGVRGVGKTTCARILAKALNCLGDPETREPGVDRGPTASPCLRCPACREIAEGLDLDVREIDGASYNGVDEVRKLQDTLPYRPTRDRFKIFIIDEVHMLSQSAWNAFLKTLEEPPAHVKFIFATTEVHKVPITILSRVQRFDFKLLSPALIAQRLKYVLEKEAVKSDEVAVSMVARQAEGSMRDAMSLLDQVLAYNSAELCGPDVARLLGVASHRVIYDLVEAVLTSQLDRVLSLIQDLVTQGVDLGIVARDLLHALRDLVVVRACKEPETLLELGGLERDRVAEVARLVELDDLLRVHQGFSQHFDAISRTSQPRAALEMLLVRLGRRPPLMPVDDLIARLEGLERRLGTGGPPVPGGTIGSSGGSSGPGRGRPPAPRASSPAPGQNWRQQLEGEAVQQAANKPAVSVDGGSAPAPSQGSEPPAIAPVEASVNGAVGAPVEITGTWGTIVEAVRAIKPDLAAFLGHAHPKRLDRQAIVLGFEKGGVFQATVEKAENLQVLAAVALSELGGSPKVSFVALEDQGQGSETVARQRQRELAEQEKAAVAQARQHPLVVQTARLLGGRIKAIRLPDSSR